MSDKMVGMIRTGRGGDELKHDTVDYGGEGVVKGVIFDSRQRHLDRLDSDGSKAIAFDLRRDRPTTVAV